MRKIGLLFALASLALGACTAADDAPPPATPSTGAVGPSSPSGAACTPSGGTVADERALYVAETAYNVPAHAYVAANGTGKLPAGVKAAVKPLLQESYRLLKLAREAYCRGDYDAMRGFANGAKLLADKAKADLPPAPAN